MSSVAALIILGMNYIYFLLAVFIATFVFSFIYHLIWGTDTANVGESSEGGDDVASAFVANSALEKTIPVLNDPVTFDNAAISDDDDIFSSSASDIGNDFVDDGAANDISTPFDDNLTSDSSHTIGMDINPANGMPMIDDTGVDVMGNAYGTDAGMMDTRIDDSLTTGMEESFSSGIDDEFSSGMDDDSFSSGFDDDSFSSSFDDDFSSGFDDDNW